MAYEPPRKPGILVVDEDLLFSVRVESTLQKRGYEVYVTGNPEEALDIAQENPLSLIIINYGREGLKPMETTTKLKKLYQPAPVLGFLSHKLIPAVREEAREAGCDLLVANSALVLRLPQLVEKLAPLDGSVPQIVEAEEFADQEE
jgi:CheY-like chemotaxis protein